MITLASLFGLGVASLATSAVATGVNSYLQSKVQKSNAELQADSLQLQREQFAYQKDYDVWQKNLAERNFQLQSSPVSSLITDAAKVGVNPMAAMGQSVGSASVPSSSANTGFGASSTPLMDTGLSSMMSMLGNVISTGMQVKTQKDIADKSASLRQQELNIIEENNKANIGLGSERNSIARTEAVIHQQLANANDKMTLLEFQKFAHQKIKDIKTYLLDKARFEFSKNFSDKEYALQVTKFNKDFDEEVRQFNEKIKTADRDRRMQYITRLANSVSRLFGSLFGRAPSIGFDDYQSNEIGFKVD